MTLPTGLRQKHPDWAVRHPSRRPTILPLHSRRVRSLFQKAGLVYHQNTIDFAYLLDDVLLSFISYRIGTPHRATQQALHPIRGRFAGLFGQLPAILALDFTP